SPQWQGPQPRLHQHHIDPRPVPTAHVSPHPSTQQTILSYGPSGLQDAVARHLVSFPPVTASDTSSAATPPPPRAGMPIPALHPDMQIGGHATGSLAASLSSEAPPLEHGMERGRRWRYYSNHSAPPAPLAPQVPPSPPSSSHPNLPQPPLSVPVHH